MIFSSIKDVRDDAKLTLITKGHEITAGHWQGTDALSKEIMLEYINYNFTVRIPNSLTQLEKECEPDMPWADIHFKERISGMPLNPGESYKIWPYNKFKDGNDPYLKHGFFDHTYMERYWSKSSVSHIGEPLVDDEVHGDLNDVIELLKKNIHTRQAFLPVWFPIDTGNINNQRVPCSLGYSFYYRGTGLHCNYYIRSCDYYRHFKNDMYLTCRLAQHIMKEVCQSKNNIEYNMGYLNMYITHFHLFKNDIYLINKQNGTNNPG